MTKKIISLVALALIVSACSSNRNVPLAGATTPATGEDTSTQMADASAPKNDDEIVNMLLTVNTEEMNLAKLGKNQAQDSKVKEFANHMMAMHAKSNDEASMLRKREKIALSESIPSNTLKIVTEDKIEAMRSKKGKEFDRAFIQAQVELHQKALQKLQTSLIPYAQNAQLKAMLEKTKGEVQHHLEMAQNLQTSVQ